MIGAWMLAACSWLSGPKPLPEPDGVSFELVYTADVHGEIEPCG
jgi:hypothetical protein